MQVFFKEKPTTESTSQYEEKLNYYLQYLNAKVKIKLLDQPNWSESFIDEKHDKTYHWIDTVEVRTPQIAFETHLFSQILGHDGEFFDEKYAWTDAFNIQDSLYVKLGKFKAGFGVGNGDPYWKLWSLIGKN